MEIIFLTFLCLSVQIVYGEVDPCTTAGPLENVSKRGTACLGTTLSSMVCDRYLQEGWYYAEHEGGRLTMPTSCPPMLTCGTGGAFWLNGIHPSGVNETADVNVCMRGLPTEVDPCCTETFPIKVKNCGQFYVYHLTYTSRCDQAYCFGDHECEDSSDHHDGDKHDDDDDDDDGDDDDDKHPWKHKSGRRKLGLVVIVAVLFIGSIVCVIVVIMAKRRCQVNKGTAYEENPNEKQVPIVYSSEPKKQPLPVTDTYDGNVYPTKPTAPINTVWNTTYKY